MAKRVTKKVEKTEEVVPEVIKTENIEPTGFKETEAKLESVDNILTKITKILKKHWLVILLILLGLSVYEFIMSVKEDMNKPKVEDIIQSTPVITAPIENHFVVREYDEEQTDGTYKRILVWSDSVETVDENYKY